MLDFDFGLNKLSENGRLIGGTLQSTRSTSSGSSGTTPGGIDSIIKAVKSFNSPDLNAMLDSVLATAGSRADLLGATATDAAKKAAASLNTELQRNWEANLAKTSPDLLATSQKAVQTVHGLISGELPDALRKELTVSAQEANLSAGRYGTVAANAATRVRASTIQKMISEGLGALPAVAQTALSLMPPQVDLGTLSQTFFATLAPAIMPTIQDVIGASFNQASMDYQQLSDIASLMLAKVNMSYNQNTSNLAQVIANSERSAIPKVSAPTKSGRPIQIVLPPSGSSNPSLTLKTEKPVLNAGVTSGEKLGSTGSKIPSFSDLVGKIAKVAYE